MKRSWLAAAVSALVCGGLLGDTGRAADWPQLQGNAAHTGYTADQPGPPYRLKWKRDLQEPTQSAAQPIAAGDKMFVGDGLCGRERKSHICRNTYVSAGAFFCRFGASGRAKRPWR